MSVLSACYLTPNCDIGVPLLTDSGTVLDVVPTEMTIFVNPVFNNAATLLELPGTATVVEDIRVYPRVPKERVLP